MNVQFRKLHADAVLPFYATPRSSCFDVVACLPMGAKITSYDSANQQHTHELRKPEVHIRPGERYLIPTGWAVACPSQHSLRFYSRSGLALKQGLILVNGVGIIDEDYRHEVCVIFANITRCSTVIEHGSRICQGEFVPVTNFAQQFVMKAETDENWFTTERNGGFGSTGMK